MKQALHISTEELHPSHIPERIAYYAIVYSRFLLFSDNLKIKHSNNPSYGFSVVAGSGGIIDGSHPLSTKAGFM